MSNTLLIIKSGRSDVAFPLPPIITDDGPKTTKRFLEFFAVNIRNPNTRLSYARAIGAFLFWCNEHRVSLPQIEPMIVAGYIEQLTQKRAPQTVKQHLAAIRMLFDWMVVGQVMPFSPAASVKGPRYSIKKGKTPVLSAEETRKLLDSIDISHVVGLRDRALIGLNGLLICSRLGSRTDEGQGLLPERKTILAETS
ncbi:MAG: tyrosine-type recombinase/integrase [Pyrinomonadaceae bacterium]